MSSGDVHICFKGDNPGAVRYGNFINYYQFHPATNRIEMLPSTIWNKNKSKYVCLDIGCNAGDLTVALYEYFTQNVCPNIYMLGVDIDPTLITRAEEKNKDITFKCLDVTNDSQRTIVTNYLADCNEQAFDVIFCFSTSMWIHLNHGDDGLKEFLCYVCKNSKLIVIEPQPWKCYRTAVKRLKLTNHEFPHFKLLQIKTNVEKFIEQFILGQNFEKIHESPDSKWGRKILFFVKEK